VQTRITFQLGGRGSAEIALLVASATATAGEGCTIEAAERSIGGSAIVAIRSARRDMAASPKPLPAKYGEFAVVSAMTIFHRCFQHHIQPALARRVLSQPQLNG
jgi:hypothetical protein